MTSRTVEFGTKAEADAVREKHADLLCSDDDARLKRVRFSSSAPDELLERLQDEAAGGRAEREGGPGQLELTDAERERLDFSQPRTNVPHARSVKAIAAAEGVDDWTSFYDGTLTVDEHREVMERAARDERGQNLDAEETADEQLARATTAARSDECDHARGHCVHGEPEACEFLQERCGYDEEEVAALLDGPREDAGDGELTGPELGALKRAWGGYQGATAGFVEGLERAAREWRHAQQAARAINAIRDRAGQEPLHFEKLEGGQAKLADLAREAAADCHECHLAAGPDGPTAEASRKELADVFGDAERDPMDRLGDVGEWDFQGEEEIRVAGEDRPGWRWYWGEPRQGGSVGVPVRASVLPTSEDPDVYRANVGNLELLEAETLARGRDREGVLEAMLDWLERHPEGPPDHLRNNRFGNRIAERPTEA